ncbi:alpha/beta fold hydrolase [Georgenia sp. Z1344]|uniref:alpha/beta fold hydrolase n=1 Tax=Georgenia sp. Z1344 TaxID=3416706 RepID=UPI003CEA46DE
MFPDFQPLDVELDGVRVRGRLGPSTGRPPLLLLHGHPETHVMWHRVAPQLARQFDVVLPDLRGYGRSGRPAPGPDHAAYSKRTMARDAVELMAALGHERFAVVGHDRGARVAARLAGDHPDRVSAAMLLDVAPTLDMYEATDRAFASAYWHWFFLIQPAPMPEALAGANPRGYVEGVMGARHAGLAPFPPEVLDEYVAGFDGAERAAGAAHDYRAANGIDLEHDRADRAAGRRIEVPLRVLWARHGVIERLFDPLALWGRIADEVSGHAVDCGHYLPEEAPDEIVREIREFLGA